MARPATGTVVEREGVRGRSYALRFRVGGKRQFEVLARVGPQESRAGTHRQTRSGQTRNLEAAAP